MWRANECTRENEKRRSLPCLPCPALPSPRPFPSGPPEGKGRERRRHPIRRLSRRSPEPIEIEGDRQSARPLPSPVHRYSASTSRRRCCCSPKSSRHRPRTWARAERMTLRKLRCQPSATALRIMYDRGGLIVAKSYLILGVERNHARLMRAHDGLARLDDAGAGFALQLVRNEEQ